MKASEIIYELRALIGKHGDLEVYTQADWEQETDGIELREPGRNPWGGREQWDLPRRFTL